MQWLSPLQRGTRPERKARTCMMMFPCFCHCTSSPFMISTLFSFTSHRFISISYTQRLDHCLLCNMPTQSTPCTHTKEKGSMQHSMSSCKCTTMIWQAQTKHPVHSQSATGTHAWDNCQAQGVASGSGCIAAPPVCGDFMCGGNGREWTPALLGGTGSLLRLARTA